MFIFSTNNNKGAGQKRRKRATIYFTRIVKFVVLVQSPWSNHVFKLKRARGLYTITATYARALFPQSSPIDQMFRRMIIITGGRESDLSASTCKSNVKHLSVDTRESCLLWNASLVSSRIWFWLFTKICCFHCLKFFSCGNFGFGYQEYCLFII